MRYLALLILWCAAGQTFAQIQFDSNDEKLSFYGDVMVSALEPEHRVKSSDAFYQAFKEALDTENVFEKDMQFLQTISVLHPESSNFKLISWQLEKAESTFEYKAFVVFEDGTYVELIQNLKPSADIAYMQLSPQDWYGALYYNIKPLDKGRFVIFGYNGYDQYESVKVADVLLVKDKEILLGDEIFEDMREPETYMNRLMLRYSSDASVNLNYNPGMEMIVFDHLMQRMGRLDGQGITMIPDGTYEGYKWEKSKWNYIEKLFDHSYGENNAPRPQPVLDNKKKNLFGKSGN